MRTDYLLDTCMLVKLLTNEKIPRDIRVIVESLSEAYASTLSLIEMAQHINDNKDYTPKEADFKEVYNQLLNLNGLKLKFISPDIDALAKFSVLPYINKYSNRTKTDKMHRDQLDRLIVCQAMSTGYTLVTVDATLPHYFRDSTKCLYARNTK